MSKVLITTSSFGEFNPAPLDLLKENNISFQLNPYKRKLTKDELLELIQDVEATIAGVEPYDEDLLNASSLKVISRVGSGLSSIDLDAAKKKGVKVLSTPDAPVESVAELTMAGLLSCLRRIPQQNNSLKNGEWKREKGNLLNGKTVCIVGCGRIGQRFAQLLQPFNVKLIAVDPFIDTLPEGFHERKALEAALPESDIVSLHVNNAELILGKDQFKLMKPGTILLNPSRGELLDEQALVAALEAKTVGAAWLDVFANEPYTGPLQNFSQVILTPHVGSFTAECRAQMEYQAVENLLAHFS